ncbi:MAG: hypothetical protein C0621_03625 [Desulfuromonas sp.]|nr:MAG: hypothetical protein C0621_03625 [Desulfuromonas sp.]
MQKNMMLICAVASAALLTLSGCGSNRESNFSSNTEAESLGASAAGVSLVGSDVCIECHAGFSWSAQEVDKYLAGKHTNNHAGSAYGFDYMEANACTECHDPIGESLGKTDNDGVDQVVVGCENCHGAGGEHFGVGPMPNPLPGSDTCGECHNTLPESHLPHHPDADSIYERYAASAHAGSAGPDRSEYSSDESKLNGHMGDHLPFGHSCVKCHTHEGAIEYLEVDDATEISAIDDGSGKLYTSMQCKTCHDPHEAGKLLEPAVHEEHPVYAEDGTLDHLEETTISSAQYNTCVNCHEHEDFHLGKNVTWSMLETHGDDATSNNTIEGYVIDETAEDACSACHDVHSADTTINAQWAKSGHAAEIAIFKEEEGPDGAISMAYEEERHSVIAFTEFNFAFDADRESCQRCHTTTGAKNYLSDPANYDASANDFSHLDPVYDATTNAFISSKSEMLYCGGCHSSTTTGDLLVDGSDITLDYTYDGADIVLEGVNESKVCLTCHGGWGNNDSLRAITDANRDFHGVMHHGPAGAILFANQTHAGYEFDGQTYSTTSAHSQIGTTDAAGNEVVPGTGTAGPCVACHMAEKNHSNTVVEAENMTITSEALCTTCHASMTAAELIAANEGRKETAAIIRSYIDATVGIKGTANPALYPLESYRVAMNWWVVYDEFGGQVHNPTYVKQIAFDTIDYLADGALDGSVTIDPVLWPNAAAWMDADAVGAITRP